MVLALDDIERRFSHHPPGAATIPLHEALRDLYRRVAITLSDVATVPSRESALALTKLEESLMWANAHIARNLDPETGDPR